MNSFTIKLIFSFFIGGSWITLITLIAERFGSKIGGLIGGIPSTVVIAFFFIGWTQGAEALYDATAIFPIVFSVNSFFFLTYVMLSSINLGLGIAGSLVSWFVFQGILVLTGFNDFYVSILAWLVILITSYIILHGVFKLRSRERVQLRYSPIQILFRGVFAGGVIALAVFMSKVGGPLFGTIFSSFPANNLSTLLITAQTVDIGFSRSIVTPLMLSAGINCVVFAIALRYTIPNFEWVYALMIAACISIISAGLIFLWFRPLLCPMP